jgi:peroxiredoxin
MRLPEERQSRRLEITSLMRRYPKITAGILIGVALAAAHAAEGVCPADAKLANLNFTFKDIHGKPLVLSDYKGKVVVLDFWATWCPPCRKEIPGFVELYSSYRSRGLVVIGISMDETPADVKRFANKLKINYPIVMGAGRDDLKPAFGDLPLPTAFVIGRDGKICVQHDGLTSKEQYEREISALLSPQNNLSEAP